VKETVDLGGFAVMGSPGFSDVLIGTDSKMYKPQSAITIDNTTTVNGDILVGVDGDPSLVISNKGTINGGTFAETSPYVWPSIDLKGLDLLTSAGNLKISGTTPYPLSAGNYRFDSIDLDPNSVLTIQGNVNLYIAPPNPKSTKALNLGNGAQLQVAPNASLNLYLDGELRAGYSGPINGYDIIPPNPPTSADATRLQIYGLPHCKEINLTVSGQFYGAIYAPDADVTMYNGFPFTGAIEAKSFTAKNGGIFTYDERLSNVSPFSEGVYFVIDRWWEGAAGETPPDIMP
jgi:hypothetical protein